jgi:hypothetical protein
MDIVALGPNTKEAKTMKKHWLRGVLLGVSLALLLTGGLALAQGPVCDEEATALASHEDWGDGWSDHWTDADNAADLVFT